MESTLAALSRRQLIECGAASLILTGSALAEAKKPFEPLPAEVKITEHNLTTSVKVNGKGPFRFVIDTGADRSVIAEDVAQALHLPVGHEVVVQGIVRAVPAQSVPVSDLRFGPVERKDLQMPVLPRVLLKADGFLGLDAIGDNRVVFDFQRQTLRVLETIPVEVTESHVINETRIDALGDGGHLRSFACRVDGVDTVAFVDTGAEVSAGNEALRKALVAAGPGHAGDRDIELTGITGGSRTGRVVQVGTILFGNLEFSGCEIAIADLDVFKIWDLSDQPALLIGLNFLREFQTVVIDYGRKQFRLKLAASGWVNKKRQG